MVCCDGSTDRTASTVSGVLRQEAVLLEGFIIIENVGKPN